jgi:hypothetical protein
MNSFEIMGYVLFVLSTVAILTVRRTGSNAVAWPSRVAGITIAAFIACLLGAKSLAPVFVIGLLIVAVSPKPRPEQRLF